MLNRISTCALSIIIASCYLDWHARLLRKLYDKQTCDYRSKQENKQTKQRNSKVHNSEILKQLPNTSTKAVLPTFFSLFISFTVYLSQCNKNQPTDS